MAVNPFQSDGRAPSRRDVLSRLGGGFGSVALAHLLSHSAALGADGVLHRTTGLHHPPKVKRVIQLFMNGGVSQMDTFDHKPLLNQKHGQKFDPGAGLLLLAGVVAGPHERSGLHVLEDPQRAGVVGPGIRIHRVQRDRFFECSACVLPRSAISWSRAAARSAGLSNRRSPSASVWSHPTTMARSDIAATVRAFSRAKVSATSPGPPVTCCSIARSSSPNSANSQFFIMLAPNASLNNKYTAYGRVVEGMTAVDTIAPGEPPEQPTKIVRASLGG